MELTTKAEPILREFKGLCGFCVSSFWALEGEKMFKKILFSILIIVFANSVCLARNPDTGYGTHIDIEIKAGDNISYKPPIVGSLEYTGNSIDIVTFTDGIAGIGIITQAWVYLITGKKVVKKGVHHIQCKNQYGVKASGTIDFRDEFKPLINLVIENSNMITNITKEGKNWFKKNLPNIVTWQY